MFSLTRQCGRGRVRGGDTYGIIELMGLILIIKVRHVYLYLEYFIYRRAIKSVSLNTSLLLTFSNGMLLAVSL